MLKEPLVRFGKGSIVEQSEGKRSHAVVKQRHSLVLVVHVSLEDSRFLRDGQVFVHSEVQLELVMVQILRCPSSVEGKFVLGFVVIQNWLLQVVHLLDRARVVLEPDVVRVAIVQVAVDLLVECVPDFVAKDEDPPRVSHTDEGLRTLDLPHDFVGVEVVEVNCRVPAILHRATTLPIFCSILLGEVGSEDHSFANQSRLDSLSKIIFFGIIFG